MKSANQTNKQRIKETLRCSAVQALTFLHPTPQFADRGRRGLFNRFSASSSGREDLCERFRKIRRVI